MDCIFCKIASGEVSAAKVYEDSEFIVFLDIAPANKGHCLAIPKKHYETFIDIPEKTLARLSLIVKRASQKITKTLKAEGYNIFMNNKPIAGQVIPHAHFHIVPRFRGDGINFEWPHLKYEEDEMKQLADKLLIK